MTSSVDNWYSIAKDASLRCAAFSMTGAIGGVRGSEAAHFAENCSCSTGCRNAPLHSPCSPRHVVVISKEKTEAREGFRLKNLLLQPDNIPLPFPTGVQKNFELSLSMTDANQNSKIVNPCS